MAGNRKKEKGFFENTFDSYSFKEIELLPGASYTCIGTLQYFVLAYIGDVLIESNLVSHTLLENQILKVCMHDEVKLFNPYPDAAISFFVLEMPSETQECFSILDSFEKSRFNTLEQITSCYHIGQFSGREKCELVLNSPNAFVFCINGAFEVNDRLLETKDALVLKNIQIIDFEALSEEAILLVFSF